VILHSNCVFQLIVDKVSRATWTRIPVARGQSYGVIVDRTGCSPESRSRCRAGMVDVECGDDVVKRKPSGSCGSCGAQEELGAANKRASVPGAAVAAVPTWKLLPPSASDSLSARPMTDASRPKKELRAMPLLAGREILIQATHRGHRRRIGGIRRRLSGSVHDGLESLSTFGGIRTLLARAGHSQRSARTV